MKALAFSVFLLAAGPISPDPGSVPDLWVNASPVIVLSVTRTNDDDLFEIAAVVTDSRTAIVHPKQRVRVRAGSEGVIGFGNATHLTVKVSCAVHIDGQTARCRTSLVRGGEVVGGYEAVLAVSSEA